MQHLYVKGSLPGDQLPRGKPIGVRKVRAGLELTAPSAGDRD
jgi:hypothetical protein